MTTLKLLTPLRGPDLTFKNRVFMAPMTRSRAFDQVATDLMATYYAQRASAGLIIAEGTQVSPQGVGYISTPGIHTPEQAAGWKKVTDAVHEKGGLIFAQLWHCGRVSHPDFHNGELPVAPSAIGFEGKVFTPEGFKPCVVPRALSIDEIKEVIGDYRNAAKMAKEAGFDGIEIHGANGYLPHQFLESASNHRTDEYGGSIENRARFALEVVDAVSEIWNMARICYRISPLTPFFGMHDSSPEATYTYFVEELDKRGLGLLHAMREPEVPEGYKDPILPKVRKLFSSILIANFRYDRDTAEHDIVEGLADAVAFGRHFLANPDLPRRFELDAPLNTADHATFYGGGAEGFTDYPTLPDSKGV